MDDEYDNTQWRIDKQGILGWCEIIIKLIAVGVAFGSLSEIGVGPGERVVIDTLRQVQLVFLGIGPGLIWFISIIWKIIDKEIIAIAFHILIFIAHIILISIRLTTVDPGAFIFSYCFLMILGEYVRLMAISPYVVSLCARGEDDSEPSFAKKSRVFSKFAEWAGSDPQEWNVVPTIIYYSVSTFLLICWIIILSVEVVIWLTQFPNEN